jgi:hypothetical protein
MMANGRPDGSYQVPLPRTVGSGPPKLCRSLRKHESDAASQTCDLLTHGDSGELPMEESSQDKESGEQ